GIIGIENLNYPDSNFYQGTPDSIFINSKSKNPLLALLEASQDIPGDNQNLIELYRKLGLGINFYELEALTGDVRGGQTDETPIRLKIQGRKGLLEVQLDSMDKDNSQFERKGKDIWTLASAKNLGEILSIEVQVGDLENRGFIDDWLLEKLILKTPDGYGPYEFVVNTWIGDYKDRKQNIVLVPSDTAQKTNSSQETTTDQTPNMVNLTGIVYDESGFALEGIEIRDHLGKSFTETTFSGEFEFGARLLRANAVRLRLMNKRRVSGAGDTEYEAGSLRLDTLIYVDKIGPKGLVLRVKEQRQEQSPEQRPLEQNVPAKYIPPVMVKVEGGTFLMGSPEDEEGRADNEVQHEVRLGNFEIGKYEVTFEEYDRFCEAQGREKPADENYGRGRRPVINVSWMDAVEYCNWLSIQAGYEQVYKKDSKISYQINDKANGYRLPTEAEWEFAAKGGLKSQKTRYSGSNNLSLVAWHGANSVGPSLVGQKEANELKIFDMSGNVWEWCNDWYGDYVLNQIDNPKGIDLGDFRVVRGGAWDYYDNNYFRSSFRYKGVPPEFYYSGIGFRILRRL
ncbi:MAG: SUMF1/EgtB/PvdO family nonheme iron enzyme, partial [Bacteroidota bacterium]